MSLIDRIPHSQLPREHLLRDGAEALSFQELLAILLRTGVEGKSVLVLAQELLEYFGGIEGLLDASIEELTAIKGVGQAKAITLKAAFGIGLRISKEQVQLKKMVLTVEDAVKIAKPEIGHLTKEVLFIILRDIKARLLHREIISIGTQSQVLVHPREVFQPAVRHGAHSLVVCHNHPSGDPTPSKEDIFLTKQLAECAKIMGIGLVDHIIIGKEAHESMRTLGHL